MNCAATDDTSITLCLLLLWYLPILDDAGNSPSAKQPAHVSGWPPGLRGMIQHSRWRFAQTSSCPSANGDHKTATRLRRTGPREPACGAAALRCSGAGGSWAAGLLEAPCETGRLG